MRSVVNWNRERRANLLLTKTGGALQSGALDQIVGRERNQRACHRHLAANAVVSRRINSTVGSLPSDARLETMALAPCSCGYQCSITAEMCPRCGRTFRPGDLVEPPKTGYKRDGQTSPTLPEPVPAKSPQTNQGTVGCLVAAGIVLVLLILCYSIGKQKESTESEYPITPGPVSSTVSTSSVSKETRILQEQKAASANLTLRAVDLIKENRKPEVRRLYKSRWNELASLRAKIVLDHDLNAAEKQNIDRALQTDQEAITEVLAKYDQMYGP